MTCKENNLQDLTLTCYGASIRANTLTRSCGMLSANTRAVRAALAPLPFMVQPQSGRALRPPDWQPYAH